MKRQINFGERPWHRWFAWYPIRLSGTNTKVWLEYVERMTYNVHGYLIHKYRLIR